MEVSQNIQNSYLQPISAQCCIAYGNQSFVLHYKLFIRTGRNHVVSNVKGTFKTKFPKTIFPSYIPY